METQNIYFDGKSVGTLRLLEGMTDITLDGSNPEIASLTRRVRNAVEKVGLSIIVDGWDNDYTRGVYFFEIDAMPEQVSEVKKTARPKM